LITSPVSFVKDEQAGVVDEVRALPADTHEHLA